MIQNSDEKKLIAPVGSIQKFSTEDGPGIRTTVFLKGCPLRCIWCHNPEMISYEAELIQSPGNCIHCGYCIKECPTNAIYVDADGQIAIDRTKCDRCFICAKNCYAKALRSVTQDMTVGEVMHQVLQDKDFYDNTEGGMTISGGEVLSHTAFALALIEEAGVNGISVCIDTSGYGDTANLLALAGCDPVTDILFDMKCIDGQRHLKLTGVDNTIILNNLIRISQEDGLKHKLVMRMPLIHGLNDDMELMERTADFYLQHKITRVTLLPYHNLGVSKARNVGKHQESYESPSQEHLEQIRDLFESKAGMKVEILGI